MHNLRRQRGMTLWGWVVVLALIAFFTLLALKLVPIYLSGYTVVSSLKSLENDSSVRGQSARELRDTLMKRLDINSVYDLPRDQIFISKVKNGYQVEVQYDRQEKIAGNLSVLVEFHETVVVPDR